MSTASHDTHGDHGHGDHPPFLAHHFDTPQQQFESGKLGMWVFLATEILMFGGLFCYYAYNRGNFPAVAEYSHYFLNPVWGGINTVVLLVSSFTMAWGVRAAQLGQKSLLVVMLILTLLGACGFMVIKAIEYNEKFSHDIYPGSASIFSQAVNNTAPEGVDAWAQIHHLEEEYGFYGDAHHAAADASHAAENHDAVTGGHGEPAEASATGEGNESHAQGAKPEGPVAGRQDPATGQTLQPQTAHLFANPVEHSAILPAAVGPAGLAAGVLDRPVDAPAGSSEIHFGRHLPVPFAELSPLEQQRVPSFFSVYYMMTGLHGIHVLIGMGLIGWILLRSIKGEFGPEYYTPVDIVGLYWHLVDLIWIFLFPLLYLID